MAKSTTSMNSVVMTVKCAMCDKIANHGAKFVHMNEEVNFYGCGEHFLLIVSEKVNSGYEFGGGFNVVPSKEQVVEEKVEVVEARAEVIQPVMVQKIEVVVSKPVPVVVIESNPVEVEKPTLVRQPQIDKQSGREISETGRLRAVIDEAEAEDSGFVLKRPLYSIGTKVVEAGVENFKRSRVQFEQKPLIEDACIKLIEKIQDEQRRDAVVKVNDIGMLPDGRITRMINNEFNRNSVVLAGPKTLGQLMMRSKLSNTSAGYLECCPPMMRAQNVNYWMAATDNDKELKLRTRKIMNGKTPDHEVYAIVGPDYSTFDADKIAQIASAVCPKDGRAEIVYDGFRTRIAVEFHSDIKPEDCVAGELFKAGIIIRTSDTGDGAIKVSAFVERNLCLNLIIIDQAIQTVVKRRHTGDQDEIAKIITKGIAVANQKIAGFVSKWGFANKEDLLKNTIDLEYKDDAKSPRFSLSHELFMAGLFNGMIDQEMITVRGKKETAIENLIDAWTHEPMMTRAGTINAITRYAHESEQSSPWDEDTLQEEAGRILFSNRPLPWLSPEE